jgi:hypothetical protein
MDAAQRHGAGRETPWVSAIQSSPGAEYLRQRAATLRKVVRG